jgi:predicted amidophosphoribosyltransferase
VYKLYTKNREKMPCKGICIRCKTSGRYATGNKRCQECNLFIKWDGAWCPCCGYKLRTRPRHSKFKTKLREQKLIQEVNSMIVTAAGVKA